MRERPKKNGGHCLGVASVAAHPSGLIAASAFLDMGQVKLLNRRERQGKKEDRDEREMEIKLKWKFCFFWVEKEDGEIGEEEDERDTGEREKKNQRRTCGWGEKEKSNFFKKVKSKKYYFNNIEND
jgi:hypothetical protein